MARAISESRGLKIMYELALRYGGEPVLLKNVARRHRISEKYLSKLVIPLRGMGLITSFRGAHGGYALARAPRAITLREIVQALEGSTSPAAGVRRRTGSEPADEHPTDAVWVSLDRTINEALSNVTLEAVVRTARSSVLNYQI
jgi:Rrf2 family protein